MKKIILTALLLLNITNAQSININAKAFIIKDITSGNVIASKKANKILPPASTTKLMTLYLIFEQLEQGKFKLTDRVTISKKASNKGGSKMFLDIGSKVRVVDLIKGIAVDSGNDASIAMAEHIAGSEKNFVKMMNKKAKLFKMKNTYFVNATGWDNKSHVSTANDLAILWERVFIDFPQYRTIYKLKSFKYNKIRQYNKNLLLGQMGVDGMKTGHVNSIGYNIITSAKNGKSRYIVVLLGAKTKKLRKEETKKLLKYAYTKFNNIKLLDKNTTIAQSKIFLGEYKYLDLGIDDDLFITINNDKIKKLKAEITYYPIVNAPIYYGDVLGKITIFHPGLDEPIYKDLIAKSSIKKLSGINKYITLIKYKLTK